jgi:hypothetical protein
MLLLISSLLLIKPDSYDNDNMMYVYPNQTMTHDISHFHIPSYNGNDMIDNIQYTIGIFISLYFIHKLGLGIFGNGTI